jgi:hypothetical protein
MTDDWHDLKLSDKFLGKVISVTGSEPYSEAIIRRVIFAENGIIGDKGIWVDNQIIVVGNVGFDRDLLKKSINMSKKRELRINYMSQEDFRKFHIYGTKPNYSNYDVRVKKHRGLSFLKSINVKWIRESKEAAPTLIDSIEYPEDTKIKPIKLPWRILPPGEHPFPALLEHFKQIQRDHPEKRFEFDRIEKVHSLCPDKAYTGEEDFYGYVIFLFERFGRAVLECPISGNAIYIIEDNWLSLSRRSKADLIWDYSDNVTRIVHIGDWFSRLTNLLTRV